MYRKKVHEKFHCNAKGTQRSSNPRYNQHALIIDVDSEKILQKLSVVSIKSPLKSKELAKSFVVKWVLIHGNNV